MSVTIFTMTHKKFHAPEDKMYVPLQVGKAISADLGYQGDDTGDSISCLNRYYSELTGVYWIWKNYRDADHVGVCHYRRYLITQKGSIFKESELEEILQNYEIITTKRLKLNFSYYDGYAKNYHLKDLIETGKVLKEKYPEYYEVFERLVHQKETYFGNIMVASKKLFDEYAAWLFDIFFEVQKRIDVESYDDYHKRVFGFISEFLLYVWIQTKQLKTYECKVGMIDEKAETKEMKAMLANFFAEKDIQGARTYFEASIKKRPDVLMEASDITGELKLSMQIIATSEMEMQHTKRSILDEISEFRVLISYMSNLNQKVNRYRFNTYTKEDADFLMQKIVSPIAIQVAVMVLCISPEASVVTLLRIAEDMKKARKIECGKILLKRCLEYDPQNEKVLKLLTEIQDYRTK